MNFIKEKITKKRNNDGNSLNRIYLIGKEFLQTKFQSGNQYSYIVDFENKTVKIVPYISSKANGKGKVSKKKVKDEIIPVLDIENSTISSVFEGVTSCKVTIFDEEIIVEAIKDIKEIENSQGKGNIISFKTAKKENKVKFSIPTNKLDIFLKKAVGAENIEQISFFDNDYSFSTDSYTQRILPIIQPKKQSIFKKALTYLELFAGSGIGGLGLERHGFKSCGYYSEFDKDAIKNYEANFPNRKNLGDITKIDEESLEDFDILIGGSPCTDISLMKKDREGLAGKCSSLFFDFIRILNFKKPAYFIFENVKSLLTSNNGDDFSLVKKLLEKFYNIKYKVLDTVKYGIPQIRRRIYIVGQLKELGKFDFEFPAETGCLLTVQDLLEKQVDDKYYLTEKMAKTVLSRGTGGWDANPETDLKIARPLTATMHKMHRASQDNYYHTEYAPIGKTNLRRLTPREAARLQGLPDSYKFVVSDSQAYRLMGNAMSLNLIEKIAEALAKVIKFPLKAASNNLIQVQF